MLNKKNLFFTSANLFLSIILAVNLVLAGVMVLPVKSAPNTIRVPQDQPTIQAAINAAVNGDLVLVSPGTYYENLMIAGKTITLGSLYHTTQDDQYIGSTIIDLQAGAGILFESTVGPETTIEGFTIRNGLDGIFSRAKINIFNNHILNNKDGINFRSGGGITRGNIIEFNTDDGIDFDRNSEALIENNTIQFNDEDGIEIRLDNYTGPALILTFRNNLIIGNGQDGIQLISNPEPSNRIINIERNLFKNNDRVGLGMLDNGSSGEDYRAASITDRVHLFNNTFNSNRYAVTGGDNLIALNNIFVNSWVMGLKNVDGTSIAAYNLFWNNALDQSGSNLDFNTSIFANPYLDLSDNIQPGSPAIDAGTDHFVWNGETVLDIPPGSYNSTAPDIGAYESNYTPNSPTFTPTPGQILTFYPSDDASIRSLYPNSNYGSDVELQVDGSPLEDSLIKFTVSGLNGRTINRATLRLYNVNSSYSGGDFRRVPNNSWNESNVTWNNAPNADGEILFSLRSVTLNNWYDVDLTSLITGDGTYSIRVSSTDGDGADYSSKEGSNPPQLHVGVIGFSNPTATSTPPVTQTPSPSPTPSSTPTPTNTAGPTPTPTSTVTPIPTPLGEYVRFAAIGDYGSNSINEARVATLVASWNPEFVITTGDNNYPIGAASTIDENVGKYYNQYIGNYQGVYGPGSTTNRFWPSLGNHDWDSINCSGNSCSGPYFDYFTLPNNERYYDVDYGLVHLFVINSDNLEPDGVLSTSIQASWLQNALSASDACFNVVYLHHPPYSSGQHGSRTDLRWPYEQWGADVVLAGHDHTYERIENNGFPYFVNGVGGSSLYGFDNIGNLPSGFISVVRYNQDFGAMLITATEFGITYQFINANAVMIDEYTVNKNCIPPTPTATNTPLPTATNTSLPTATNTPLPTTTNTPLPTATITPLPTATNTPLPTATNTPLPTATNTPIPTATNTPLPTATNTPLPTATLTPLPTATNTPLPTATNTPIPTATNTPLPTATNTPLPTATNTPLPTATITPLPTATNTPLSTATNTPLPTATNTPLPTATNTPLPTATNTPLPTATNTPLPTATNTPLPTSTSTPLPTATNTPLPTATNTPLPTATNTPLPTATSTPIPPTPTPTSLPDLIFADGFESGNMSAWSSSATGGGDLSVTAGAALTGNYGLSALINDLDLLYVTDDRPAAEPAYRARFYMHTNGTRMPGNKGFVVFYGYSVTNTPILLIEIQSTKGGYLLRSGASDNNNNWTYTAWVTVTDASHIVEISWWAASGTTSGGMVFWVDGTPRANLTGINNNTHRIERVSLGAVDALHPAIGGTVFFDAFESRRQTYIGP